MLQSMTGYGKAEANLENGKFIVEIRSVNGKNADINLKTSLLPKDKEIWLRKYLAESLQRGTIDFFLNFEQNEGSAAAKALNGELVKEYFRQIRDICRESGVEPDGNIMSAVLRMPDVVDSKKDNLVNEENWPLIEAAIASAVESIQEFRRKEGEALHKDLSARIEKILEIYLDIEKHEPERITAIRERILKAASEMDVKVDKERFEQEMIFYLEKLDITEEKVRLRQHCKYFVDTMNTESFPGKKLGFIIQEIGREINTTGSKANDADIQRDVVMMKDELEKIREQSMNIL